MNKETSLSAWLRRERARTALLLKSVPPAFTAVFVASVILMNFLARFTLVSLPWLALNAGILVSWLSFLYMDVVTRRFGAGAANRLSLLAIAANLACCAVCVVISRVWNHPELDMVVGGQWSILLASTVAYIISALSNNYTNVFIGRRFAADPDSKRAFAARSFISTFFSQVLDNFIFVALAFVVFPNLPGALPVRWTLAQCAGASVTCAVMELLSEVIFAPLGYVIIKRWKERDVGRDYLTAYCPGGVL